MTRDQIICKRLAGVTDGEEDSDRFDRRGQV